MYIVIIMQKMFVKLLSFIVCIENKRNKYFFVGIK